MTTPKTTEQYLIDHGERVIGKDKIATTIFTNVAVRYHKQGKEIGINTDNKNHELLLAIHGLDDETVVNTLLNDQVDCSDRMNQKTNSIFALVGLCIALFAGLYCFSVVKLGIEPTGLMDFIKSMTELVNNIISS